MSVVGKCLAQNSDTFKIYRFPACKKQIILQEVQGSGKVICYMEAFMLAELILWAQFCIIYAEKS